MTELELDAICHNAARAMDRLESITNQCSQFETVFLVPDVLIREFVSLEDMMVIWCNSDDVNNLERIALCDPMLYGHRVVFIETGPFDEIEIIPAVVSNGYGYPVFDTGIYVLDGDGVYLTETVVRTHNGVNVSASRRKIFNISGDYVTRNDVRKPRIPEFDASYNTDEIDKFLSEIAVSDN